MRFNSNSSVRQSNLRKLPAYYLFTFLGLPLLLAACGGGSSSSSPSVDADSPTSDPNTNKYYASGTTLGPNVTLGRAVGGQALTWDKSYVADLTGDGEEELLIYTSFDYLSQQDPSPFVIFGFQEGKFQDITSDLFPDGAPQAIINRNLEVADFNGDGINDLFLDNHGTEAFSPFPGEQNRLYLSDGSGQFFDATETHLPSIRDFSHGSSVGNIDDDPEPEIYVVNLGGGEAGYSGLNYLMDQNEQGVYEKIADLRNDFGGTFPVQAQNVGRPFFSTLVDLTGDGKMEIYGGPVTFPDFGEVGYGYFTLVNDGSGAFDLADPATLPAPRVFPDNWPPVGIPETIITGDIDADGDMDIISYDRYGSFVGSYFSVFINNADGTFSDETEQRLPGQSFEATQANIPNAQLVDLDSDGHLDFIAKAFDFGADPDGNAFVLWIYLNDGSGNLVEQEQNNYPEFRPSFAVLDTNGDGLNDIVSSTTDYSQPDPEAQIEVFLRSSN